jgi:hypothetical protein
MAALTMSRSPNSRSPRACEAAAGARGARVDHARAIWRGPLEPRSGGHVVMSLKCEWKPTLGSTDGPRPYHRSSASTRSLAAPGENDPAFAADTPANADGHKSRKLIVQEMIDHLGSGHITSDAAPQNHTSTMTVWVSASLPAICVADVSRDAIHIKCALFSRSPRSRRYHGATASTAAYRSSGRTSSRPGAEARRPRARWRPRPRRSRRIPPPHPRARRPPEPRRTRGQSR